MPLTDDMERLAARPPMRPERESTQHKYISQFPNQNVAGDGHDRIRMSNSSARKGVADGLENTLSPTEKLLGAE